MLSDFVKVQLCSTIDIAAFERAVVAGAIVTGQLSLECPVKVLFEDGFEMDIGKHRFTFKDRKGVGYTLYNTKPITETAKHEGMAVKLLLDIVGTEVSFNFSNDVKTHVGELMTINVTVP
jgi:hypothetical protein